MLGGDERQQSRPNVPTHNSRENKTPEISTNSNLEKRLNSKLLKDGTGLTEITRATHLNKGDLSVSQLPEYSNRTLEQTDPFYSPTYNSAQGYDDLQDTIDLRYNNMMGSGLSETIKVVENEFIEPATARVPNEYEYEQNQDFNPDLADTVYFGHEHQKNNNNFSNRQNNDFRQNFSIQKTEPGIHYYESQHQQELEIDLDDVRKLLKIYCLDY